MSPEILFCSGLIATYWTLTYKPIICKPYAPLRYKFHGGDLQELLRP